MDSPVPSVLFVDDEPALRELFLELANRSKDVAMQIAASGEEALRILEKTRFDAIIVDYEMPEITGVQFLKILRSRGDTTPVILFTGEGQERTAIEALNSGASFYLKKDTNVLTQFRQIIAMVDTAIEGGFLGKAVGTRKRIIADMVNFIPDAGFAIDANGVVIAWNEAIEKFTGVPADAMLGKGDLAYAEPFFGTKHKMLLDLVFEPDEEILRENHLLVNRIPKGQVTAITRGKKRDGSESTIWAKATPLYDARGNFIAVVGIVRDVSTVFGDVIIGYTPPE